LGEGLTRVRLAVDHHSVTGPGKAGKKRGVDRFHVPVALVLLLVVTESLIGTRRRTA